MARVVGREDGVVIDSECSRVEGVKHENRVVVDQRVVDVMHDLLAFNESLTRVQVRQLSKIASNHLQMDINMRGGDAVGHCHDVLHVRSSHQVLRGNDIHAVVEARL